jgi:allophanate hydrolase
MSALVIKQAGPMLTVQDLGRTGFLHVGVSGSGPMDRWSMCFANQLVGNHQSKAVLEFAHVGGMFEVSSPVRFAVAGGSVDISVDGERRHAWESHELRPGQSLKIGALKGAVWGYLSVSGGIETPPELGARSTHLRTAIGGLAGARLKAGDVLPIAEQSPGPLLELGQPWHRSRGPIRVIPGPQSDHFDRVAWETFLGGTFTVSASRDRMAQMLDGPQIAAAGGHDIVSDGTVPGSIQVPASGRPIVLMAERQTTGGYPKIATVASVDLPRLAQAPTGTAIRFAAISPDAAENLLIAEIHAVNSALSHLKEKSAGDLPLEDIAS